VEEEHCKAARVEMNDSDRFESMARAGEKVRIVFFRAASPVTTHGTEREMVCFGRVSKPKKEADEKAQE
jgi:hypothetical protein